MRACEIAAWQVAVLLVSGDGLMVTKKDRRHSGYRTSGLTISGNALILNDLFIELFYDDWCDYRDGQRDWYRDFKKIKNAPSKSWSHLYGKRVRMNEKQELFLKRRKAKRRVLIL